MSDFQNLLADLKPIVEALSHDLTGITQYKRELRDKITAEALRLAGPIHAFASSTGASDLKADMDLSRSELKKIADTAIGDTVQKVATVAKKHLASLADYGVTNDSIQKLQEMISDYEKLIKAPRIATINRKEYNQSVLDIVKNIYDLLNDRLDPLMETFSESHPEFYRKYFDAREIIDLGTRHEKGNVAK
jgi:hypothetical protein